MPGWSPATQVPAHPPCLGGKKVLGDVPEPSDHRNPDRMSQLNGEVWGLLMVQPPSPPSAPWSLVVSWMQMSPVSGQEAQFVVRIPESRC